MGQGSGGKKRPLLTTAGISVKGALQQWAAADTPGASETDPTHAPPTHPGKKKKIKKSKTEGMMPSGHAHHAPHTQSPSAEHHASHTTPHTPAKGTPKQSGDGAKAKKKSKPSHAHTMGGASSAPASVVLQPPALEAGAGEERGPVVGAKRGREEEGKREKEGKKKKKKKVHTGGEMGEGKRKGVKGSGETGKGEEVQGSGKEGGREEEKEKEDVWTSDEEFMQSEDEGESEGEGEGGEKGESGNKGTGKQGKALNRAEAKRKLLIVNRKIKEAAQGKQVRVCMCVCTRVFVYSPLLVSLCVCVSTYVQLRVCVERAREEGKGAGKRSKALNRLGANRKLLIVNRKIKEAAQGKQVRFLCETVSVSHPSLLCLSLWLSVCMYVCVCVDTSVCVCEPVSVPALFFFPSACVRVWSASETLYWGAAETSLSHVSP